MKWLLGMHLLVRQLFYTAPINCFTQFHRFVTDSSGAESGFRLEWEIEGCGGVLTHPTGTFSSPNYPLPYPDNTQCQWTIVADYGNIIQLIVEDFDFEKSGDCQYDGLMVN
jgi:cubilin